MRNLLGALLIAAMLNAGAPPHQVEFRHLYTYGTKEGIHPPILLNRKGVRAALGNGDHPYGLVFPVGVTTDLHRRVWIADGVTASVHVFDPVSGAYREIKRAAEAPIRQPSGIASDTQGRVYVADAAAGCIYVFDETGEFDHALMKRERVMESPGALAISEDSKSIYVADPPRNVVVELNREGEVNSTIQLPAELHDPTAVSVVHNQIYVLGGQHHRVGIFTPAGRQRGEVRWEGIAFPLAFAYDSARSRFMVVNPRWMIVEVFEEDGTGLGAFGQLGDGVDQMQRVDAMHVDSRGLVYVVDSHHGKVLVFGDAQKE
jgi:DNA-binding beta-propeller fold protein YncE